MTFTGRAMKNGRMKSNGQDQCVESKGGLPRESLTNADALGV